MGDAEQDLEFTPSPSADVLQEIGRLRVEVWRTELLPGFFPDGVWLEPHDSTGLHWFARDAGRIVAAARLNITQRVEDAVDGKAWCAAGRSIPGPVANLSRLVVLPSFERRGLGLRLILARLEKARELGAATCIVCASGKPLERLLQLGFTLAPSVRGAQLERRLCSAPGS